MSSEEAESHDENALTITENVITTVRAGLNVGSAIIAPANPLLAIAGVSISEGLGFVLGHINNQKIQKVKDLYAQVQNNIGVSDETLSEKASQSDHTPIFTEAFKQVTSDTATPERIKRIANLLSRVVEGDSNNLIAARALARMNDFDDLELVVFCHLAKLCSVPNEKGKCVKEIRSTTKQAWSLLGASFPRSSDSVMTRRLLTKHKDVLIPANLQNPEVIGVVEKLLISSGLFNMVNSGIYLEYKLTGSGENLYNLIRDYETNG